MNRFFIIILLLAIGFSSEEKKTVSIKINGKKDLRQLNELGIDLDHYRTLNEVHAFVQEIEFQKIKDLGYTIDYIPNTAKIYYEKLLNDTRNSNNPLEEYHDYNELTDFLQNINKQYSNITHLKSIGQSVQGRELWVMEITDNPTINEIEPEFKYIANMHGDETPGREFSLYLIEWLCENYNIDNRATYLVDNTAIFIMPTMNPDGFEMGMRYNANWVDLNRDFPDQFNDNNNSLFGRQPETQAVMQWSAEHNFTLSANMHSGALVVNYPYDGPSTGVYSACPDDDLFIQIALTYSNNHPNMSSGGFNNGITNGASWYAISGGMQDWNYVWEDNFDVTLEQSQNKWPNSNQLASLWNQNKESMISYIEEIHRGLKGLIKDGYTNLPIAGKIHVEGINHDIYADNENGDYYRLLTPGEYVITASHNGYNSETINISIPNQGSVEYNFLLIPDILIGDNDFNGSVNILDIIILINFILEAQIPNENEWDIADMNNDNELNVLDVILLVNLIIGT